MVSQRPLSTLLHAVPLLCTGKAAFSCMGLGSGGCIRPIRNIDGPAGTVSTWRPGAEAQVGGHCSLMALTHLSARRDPPMSLGATPIVTAEAGWLLCHTITWNFLECPSSWEPGSPWLVSCRAETQLSGALTPSRSHGPRAPSRHLQSCPLAAPTSVPSWPLLHLVPEGWQSPLSRISCEGGA